MLQYWIRSKEFLQLKNMKTKALLFFRPLLRGRNYILKWVFLFSQFWPIDIFIVEKYEWYH